MIFRKEGRYTQKDFQAAAHESEKNYKSGSANRWYNGDKTGPLFPYLVILGIGFSIISGIFYGVAYKLNSMAPTIEENQITILRKEYDERIPSKIVYARKDNGKEIKLRNKNGALEKKINEYELDEKLEVGRRYCAKIAHRKDYPEDIYGNILDIKEK
ncbi:Uncharacterised protein [uncultured archaeon]|nr:Uncharacterised protein [uncultured archaeon]